ncbi:MAG TPA: Asd/ArgC dimerization domain-containing protein [Thermoanaerobaculia bacterium]|nr:Asd/ArgC dimerization domain-containing protein [Thermoanaerobaculia bacterium]
MKVLALIHPTELVAQELRERLETRRELWRELRLLSTRQEEVGSLTEVRGGAAMVRRVEDGDLDDVDLAFFCGPMAANRALVAQLPAGATAVLLSPDADADDGLPVVEGVNLEQARAGVTLLSPHPAAVQLSLLLHPLLPLGLRDAVATVLQPVSMLAPAALDDLLQQARSLLSFQPLPESATLPHQLVFNLLPADVAAGLVATQVGALLAGELTPAVQVVQAGVFHGASLSAHLRFGEDPGAEAVREALRGSPHVRLELGEPLGPVAAAASDEVLVTALQPDPAHGGAFWLWSSMDNLTRGGALNALAIAGQVLG